MKGRIILISGERGVGKTTVCHRIVAQAREAGYDCGGILTLRTDGPSERIAVDVRSGERRPLTAREGGIRLGQFQFSPDTLNWGTETLARAAPCDLLVVDEIGPLEIERQEGWVVALDLLRMGQFELALVVVRPELVHDVQMQLPSSAPTVVTVTPENRDQLPEGLLGMLTREK
ncbi:MAG: nucleoside-triphosphatase [Anaerolineae bacterium]